MLPTGGVITEPLRGDALNAGRTRAAQDERTLVGARRAEAGVRGERHQERVLVVKAFVRVIGPVAIEAHAEGLDAARRRLVHVVPDAGDAARGVRGNELAPKRARLL